MTLATAIKFRDRAESAYLKALDAQSYGINPGGGSSRNVTRQDVDKLHEKFLYWDTEVTRKQTGRTGMKVEYGTSSD